jgi:crossover junction endodeoxyribonuclease RuvC
MAEGRPLRILGIDPGSRIMGVGVIDYAKNRAQCLFYDQIHFTPGALPQRLGEIYKNIQAVATHYGPHEVAIEQAFMHKHIQAAMTLGHARGAAMTAVVAAGIPIFEYAPRLIKKAIVGYGAAQKNQMQSMIKLLFNLAELPSADAADALAVALCHAHMRQSDSRHA